jgi:6-pyruvoyltetrahydropterin/6-carboxytetrahydropterin synthase
MLSLHPEKCKFPHGHSRRVEVVLTASELNGAGMVCDFKAIKLAVGEFIDSFDHAICINSRDPMLPALQGMPGARLVVYQETDPTTEVMAKHIFDHIKGVINKHQIYARPDGRPVYPIGQNVKLERVRVWETSSSWAEFGE